jgi:PmbA protein
MDPDRSRRCLENSMAADWPLAEIFVKTGRAERCEFGPLGSRAQRAHHETGIAIRVWDREGREGRVHADAPSIRRDEELIERAREAARSAAPGPFPRLPDGPGNGLGAAAGEAGAAPATVEERPSRPLAAEQLLDLANQLIGAFSASGREAVTLVHGWVEAGSAAHLVLNGLGREVSWSTGIVSVCLQVGGATPGPAAPHLLRYTAHAERLDAVDPALIVHEAAWRAAASLGGSPAEASGVRVVLEPHGAAAWLRTLAPLVVREPGSAKGEGSGPGDEPDPAIAPVGPLDLGKGVEIVDDAVSSALPPPAAAWDGEGRALARRALVRDGVRAGWIADSRDPGAPEAELGPMRRDSYRDRPEPGPARLVMVPGASSREDLLRDLDRGLFVTSLVPLSRPGSGVFVAAVRGVWVERGRARRSIAKTLLLLPVEAARVAAVARDIEIDLSGTGIGAPSIALEGADLVPMV